MVLCSLDNTPTHLLDVWLDGGKGIGHWGTALVFQTQPRFSPSSSRAKAEAIGYSLGIFHFIAMTKQTFTQEATIRIFAAGLNNPDMNETNAVAAAERLTNAVETVAPFNDPFGEAEQLGKAILAQVAHSQPEFDTMPDAAHIFAANPQAGRWKTVKNALKGLVGAILGKRDFICLAQDKDGESSYQAAYDQPLWVAAALAFMAVNEGIENEVIAAISNLKNAQDHD